VSLKENLRRLLPSAVRPRRILAGPLRGRYLVTSWHDYPTALLGTAEPGLLAWFAKTVRPGETWLDLGAHYGYTSMALCHYVGKTGRVFAFEPVLTTAGHLSSTREANGLSQMTVVPFALANYEEITSTRVQIRKAMAQSADAAPNHAWVEEIYCIALDTIWNRLCGPVDTISGIKIDVEGMECQVLRGMMGILHKHKPRLVIEIHKSRGVELETVAPILREAGYDPGGRVLEPASDLDRNYEFAVDQEGSETESVRQSYMRYSKCST
jgi:FkbM family methyltransferase